MIQCINHLLYLFVYNISSMTLMRCSITKRGICCQHPVLKLTIRSCSWWIIIRIHNSQPYSQRKYLKSSSQGVSSGPQAGWYSKTWHYCIKPSHSVFLLNVTIKYIRLCWDNTTVRSSFNLITSKYFNLYSTTNTNGKGREFITEQPHSDLQSSGREEVRSYRASSTEYLL